MADYLVHFEPGGAKGTCRDEESVLACARQAGLGISSVCGGRGTCQTCKVRLLKGVLSEPTSHEVESLTPEELGDGWRLACQAYPRSDAKLGVPEQSMTTTQRLQVEGRETPVSSEPVARSYHLRLPVPSLADPQADADRILAGLSRNGVECSRVDIDVLRTLTPRLRDWDWQCQATVRNDEVIALAPWPGRQLGLAVDVGTTKIAVYLVDLSDGRTLAAQGIVNPQASYGDDIISRITAAMKSPGGSVTQQGLVVAALNDLTAGLCAGAGVSIDSIVDAVVVGNTAMHHLFLGLPVESLARSPFVPVISQALDIKARDLGLHIAPGAFVHLLPNIAGFVGADHVAVLLATGVGPAPGPALVLDIGTNTEVSLAHHGRITTVSCASGPAFEGGHIRHGTRAIKGAIERLRITGDEVRYQTIEDAPPIGICGSGIVDAVAQLYLGGIIDKRGRMKANHPRIRTRKGQREFLLVERRKEQPAITITQQDIREVQLAKAAIRAGIQVLLDTGGDSEAGIKKIVIAGAFGTYIDVSSAVTIGLLPPLPVDRFQPVGNAAGMGARLALISASRRAEARAIASKVRYVELASSPGFRSAFIQGSYLGRYRIVNGQREEVE